MNWLTNIKTVITAVVAIIGGIVAIAIYWDGWTVTEAEAQVQHQAIKRDFNDYQQQQYTAFKQDRIDRHSREIDRLEFKLLSEDLTPEQREYIRRKIVELHATIQCIRHDTC